LAKLTSRKYTNRKEDTTASGRTQKCNPCPRTLVTHVFGLYSPQASEVPAAYRGCLGADIPTIRFSELKVGRLALKPPRSLPRIADAWGQTSLPYDLVSER
jgi:hypothetical protein